MAFLVSFVCCKKLWKIRKNNKSKVIKRYIIRVEPN